MLTLMFLLTACTAPTGSGTARKADLFDVEPAEIEEPLPPASGSTRLVINEVQTRNDSTVMYDGMTFPDWLEIYNAGDTEVSLGRVVVIDGSSAGWMGSSSDVLLPGQYFLLFCDEDTSSPDVAPFNLDGDGEHIELQVDGVHADRIATGSMIADTSWARFPDGGGWDVTARPSPGWSNGSFAGTRDPSDYLFQADHITSVYLTIPPASWDILQRDTNPDPSGHTNVQVPASVAYQGAYFDNVSVHLKGAWGSRRSLDQKAALKVNLNAYEDHHLRTVESLTLNNMVQDLSYVHEYLAYTVFRALGVPAPRAGWTHLYVNDTYFGLYLLLESEDDPFLARWYDDPSGRLYEGAYGVDLYPGYEYSFDYEEGPDDGDRSDLTAVMSAMQVTATDAAVANLETLVDMDEILSVMAAEVLLLHWDGYTTENNYRLYHDPLSGKFQMMPWGADQTFVSYGYGPWGGYGVLFQFCLSNAHCRARYDDILLDAADVMDALPLESMRADAVDFLQDDIEDDPRREYGQSTVTYYQNLTATMIASWPDTIRSCVEHGGC